MSFTPPPDLAPRLYDEIANSIPGVPRLGDLPPERREVVLGALEWLARIVVVAVAADTKPRA